MNDSKAHAVNVEQRHTFLFRVRACAGAVIELKRKFGQHTSGTPRFVRMTIGAARNMTKLEYVWEDGRSDVTDTFTTPMVLDCNSFRHFWYSWKVCLYRYLIHRFILCVYPLCYAITNKVIIIIYKSAQLIIN